MKIFFSLILIVLFGSGPIIPVMQQNLPVHPEIPWDNKPFHNRRFQQTQPGPGRRGTRIHGHGAKTVIGPDAGCLVLDAGGVMREARR